MQAIMSSYDHTLVDLFWRTGANSRNTSVKSPSAISTDHHPRRRLPNAVTHQHDRVLGQLFPAYDAKSALEQAASPIIVLR